MGFEDYIMCAECLIKSNGFLESVQDSVHSTIVLPLGIRVIGAFACSFKSNVETVVIPTSVIAIENNAFENCENLKDIVVPSSVKYIGDSCFKGCPNVRLNGENTDYLIWGDTLIGYRNFEAKSIDLDLPKKVNKISGEAFYRFKELKYLHIPSQIKTIGNSCFANCPKLEKIEFDGGVETIGSSAFCNDPSLKDVNLPRSVNYLGYNPFGATPKVMLEGDDHAFLIWKNRLLSYRDDQRKEIIIPQGITEIGCGTFGYEGEHARKIVFPEGITVIEELLCFTFMLLEEVILPSTIKIIKKQSFINSLLLTEVRIPHDTIVEEEAFPSSCNIIRY